MSNPARTIPLADIIIPPDRQRKEFKDEDLVSLAASIRALGLMHPVVLRVDGKTLVAGERRIRAITDLIYGIGFTFTHNGQEVPAGHVPYVTLAELDALALEEAELDENLKRVDLTWQERADAEARLHNLRTKQAEARGEVHSVADTALELTGRKDGDYQNNVRKNIILSQHLSNPEVAKAKSADEAFKILRKQEEARNHAALAAAVGQTFSKADHQALRGNCLDILDTDEWTGKFDVILTDPPYGMGADSFGDGAGRLAGIEHHYDDSYESWKDLMGHWCHLAYKVAKPQAHAYVFCDFDRFHELKQMMETAGWYVFRTPIINVKTNSGRVPIPEFGIRRQYEICLYALKGKKPANAIYSDVLSSEADEQMGHGAQKPLSLYVDLLKRSVKPGDFVLDSFSGSGTIFPACHQFKARAVGIEQNEASFGMGLKRLGELE